MKPRVLELLLLTTAPVMVLAQRAIPDLWLIAATVTGGILSGGSAAAFNMYLDRDLDARMKRTAKRPLVTGEVSPRAGLTFAWALAVASTAWFLITVNLLSAALSAFAIFFYVVVYTVLLKRRTEQNIVWGGIAGCFPTLIGWSAVTDTLAWPAVVLFVLVFLWTPAHYWPLSVNYRDDYRAANVPMLGAMRGTRLVAARVVAYAFATVLCSMVLIPAAGMGLLYSAVIVASGSWFLYDACRFYWQTRTSDTASDRSMRVFHSSITYLTLVFMAVAIDPLFHLTL
ncbi:heme o synthase [Streptomyces sp. NPDC101194]|uniref:heme o synthase n=1 Tax=Streptomyces sp. NPDC101194 TaxID=3366127 RepID=UPI00381F0E05